MSRHNQFVPPKSMLIEFLYLLIFSDLWRKETQMTQTLSQNKEELAKADQALRSMAGRVSADVPMHSISIILPICLSFS